MKVWDSTTAKQNFANLIDSSKTEPQIVERRGKPVSVIISYDKFLNSKRFNEKQSISKWLTELKNINKNEEEMIDIIRYDRKQSDWD